MCGTPVVCYNSTANPELIGENCGYVCDCDSVEAYKELVMKVLNDGKSVYSDSCINFASQNFNVEKNYNEYINLYKSLLEV